jgi:hypothetical protein
LCPFLNCHNRKVTMDVKDNQPPSNPPVRRVCQGGNCDTPLERVRLNCVHTRFSIQMDQGSSPRQRRIPKRRRPRQTLSTRNRSCDSVNSVRRPECLVENSCINYIDFVQDSSRAYVADRPHSEDRTMDSPCIHL